MKSVLLVHIAGGSLALLAGFVALYAAKGAAWHRKSGMLFVYSMVAMAISATAMAALEGQIGNFIGGLLATYMVGTALATVRPPSAASRRLCFAACGAPAARPSRR